MHDANWRRATGKAEAALEAKAEVKLGGWKRESGSWDTFVISINSNNSQQAGKQVAKGRERGVAGQSRQQEKY